MSKMKLMGGMFLWSKISKVCTAASRQQGEEELRKDLEMKQMHGDCVKEKKKKDLDSRANRVQREEGRAVGSTRVTVTAAAFEQRCTLGSRRTEKTRTKTC